MFTAWVILFGVCFSEEFGYFYDTPESADQTVEQVFSSPVDRVTYGSDVLQGVPTSTGFSNTALRALMLGGSSGVLIPEDRWPSTLPAQSELEGLASVAGSLLSSWQLRLVSQATGVRTAA